MKTLATLAEALAVPRVREVLFDGQEWKAYEDGDALPERPSDNGVPQEVTMRQARLALSQAGKLAAVSTVIAGMPEPQKTATQIWWEYSGTVQRSQPLVVQLGAAIGLTPAEVDQLFVTADSL